MFNLLGIQFKWRLKKRASQVLYLHFALKKRAFMEEIHEKQEQVLDACLQLGCITLVAL